MRANRGGAVRVQLALAQESFKRHTLFVTRPRFSSFPQPNRERLSHEVEKRRRLSGGSPRPSTRSRQKTQAMRHDIYQLRVSFSGGARPAGGAHGRASGRTGRQAVAGREAGGAHGRQSPAREQKTLWAGANAPAHSRLIKTPVLTQTQVSSSSRPNHT